MILFYPSPKMAWIRFSSIRKRHLSIDRNWADFLIFIFIFRILQSETIGKRYDSTANKSARRKEERCETKRKKPKSLTVR